MDKYLIYEIQKKTGPVSQEFYCYAIYSTKTHHVVSYPKAETQRAARKKCEEIANILSLQDETPIIWRDWPIALWPDELIEKNLVDRIRKREVS